jgi:phosphate uptake regulator
VKDATEMNSQQHIYILRVQLLAMSRLSQRALDDSIKGYQARNLDFSRHVCAAHREIEDHHRRIKELSRELMNGDIAKTSDMRFAFAAFNIAAALDATYTAAGEIARDTIRLLESESPQRCEALEDMAQLMNGSIRLCIVALFEKDARRAETVLRHIKSLRLPELHSVKSCSRVDHRSGLHDDFERAVTQRLGEVAKQAHEIADAIVFWLEGNSCNAASVEDEHIAVALPPARQQDDFGTVCFMQPIETSGRKITQRISC